MENLAVVGITWKSGARALAPFTLDVEAQAVRLPALAVALGSPELIYLATCNRVEVGFVVSDREALAASRRIVFESLSDRRAALGEAERLFRAWGDEGAVEHLFLTAAGLDSAEVGETEISGQLRRALDRSEDLGLLGPRLELVGREALKLSRRIRRETGVGAGHTSLAEIAQGFVRERMARTPGVTALVGVSPMTERCARELTQEGRPVVIVNRTLARAQELRDSLAPDAQALARGLDEFCCSPEGVEALILATGSPEPVLDRATLERLAARSPSGEPPLLVDMAVPPDVDPAAAEAVGLPRMDMEDIMATARRSRDRRLAESAQARLLVDEALERMRRNLGERTLAPMVAALQRRYRATAAEGLERLFKKELCGLGVSEREAVRRWAETLAGRFAHLPSTGLRHVAIESGPRALRAFFAGADEALLRELSKIDSTHNIVSALEVDGEDPR